MQHIKHLQQQDSGTPVIHKKLIPVTCAYHSLIHAFTWADTKVELHSETFLEVIFILPTVRSSLNPRLSRKKELFDGMQTSGEKATNKLKVPKCQRAAHGTRQTWSTCETAYPDSTVIRVLIPAKAIWCICFHLISRYSMKSFPLIPSLQAFRRMKTKLQSHVTRTNRQK